VIYFAYGSNLHPGQMFERCPGHQTLGIGRLPGHRLGFPRFSPVRRCATAGIEPHPVESVWGVLYRLSDDDLPVLHYHEGYDPHGAPENNRHTVTEIAVVRPGAAVAQTAMTYVAVADGTDQMPSRDYVDTILDGARYHQLPRAWLLFLERVVTAG